MEHRQLFFMVQRAQHSLSKLGDRVFQQTLGVSAAHLSALNFSFCNNGCLLKDLSAGMDLNNSAVTGLVRRMEAAGLVIKKACDDDGRASRVTITARGAAVVESSRPVLEKLNSLLTADFTDEEVGTVARFLATIVASKELGEALVTEAVQNGMVAAGA